MKFIGFESVKGSNRWNQCVHIAKSQFKNNFGADIEINADTFIVNYTKQGNKELVKACIGYKFYNKNSPFFIEQYFDKPLSQIIEDITGLKYHPNEICEVGNMASIGQRDGLDLLTQLPLLTTVLNKKVGFVTITKQIQFILKQIGMPFWIVCPADINRVSNNNIWGTYYENNPICAFIIAEEALSSTRKKDIILNKLEYQIY